MLARRCSSFGAIGLAVAAILGNAAALSFAADFNFTVPVRLTNLPPEIRQFGVMCSANDRLGPGGTAIGQGGSPRILIQSGGYSGNVTLSFNHSATANPANAVGYDCYLEMYAVINGQPVTFGSEGIPGVKMRTYPNVNPALEIPSAPGSTPKTFAAGPLH